MRASIIIATYNGKAYLEACLRSLQQELQPMDELIVVDNASSDGSADIAQLVWPGAKILRNSTNFGFAAACNQGATAAAGEFLVFLNQDTRVEPGWLEGLLEAFRRSPQVGLVTSKLLLMSQPDRINMCGQDIHFTGLTFGRGFFRQAAVFPNLEEVGAVSGASFAIRSELWQRLGGFDESLFMYYEETDLSWRARLAGYDSLYAPGSVAYHDYRPAQPGALALYYTKRNRYFLILKSYRWQTLLLIFPSLLLAEGLEWAHAMQIGRQGLQAKWKAMAWLVTHQEEVMRSRQESQKVRHCSDLSLLRACTDAVTPLEITGGKAAKVLALICNWFFHTNATLTRQLCLIFHL